MPEFHTEYASVADMAAVAAPYVANGDYRGWPNPEWIGVESWEEVEKLVANGWEDSAVECLDIAESAIESVQAEHEMPAFVPRFDVYGGYADVGRFLSGEPECMVDWEPIPTPKAGRVITLVSSVSALGHVSAESMRKRGYVAAALAFALSRMGFATELWADSSAHGRSENNVCRTRVLVKGPNDELDPARIMFAYAHPAMMRALSLPSRHAFPEQWIKRMGIGVGYGSSVNPKEDMPEGTIYLPCLRDEGLFEDTAAYLLAYLRVLGIVTD